MVYSELLKGIKPEWSAKYKARYLYWNLCKNIVYDQRFMYGSNEDVLRSIYYRDVDIDRDENPAFVCHSANKAYLQLLQRAGVKAKLIYKKEGVKRPISVQDVALVFWDEEGNKYYTNIVGDIENCRFGAKTAFFGITKNLYAEAQDVKSIPEDELKEMDLAIGNIKIDYLDMFFKFITNEVKNTNHFKKFLQSVGVDPTNMDREQILQNKMMYLTKLIKFTDKTASVDERKKFYKRLFCGAALDKFESKAFTAYEFFRELPDGEVDSKSVLEINMINRPIYYIYSAEDEKYLQVSTEEVPEILDGYREIKGKVPFVISQTRNFLKSPKENGKETK